MMRRKQASMATEYRDSRGANMSEATWSAIDDQLRLAYTLRKDAIAAAENIGETIICTRS